jgi:hypothetical protein
MVQLLFQKTILNNMIDVIKNLDITQFTKVYSGRQGCACGCKGTYRDTVRDFKTLRTRLMTKVNLGEDIQIMGGIGGYIVSWEGESKAIRIYTKEKLNKFVNC